MQLFYDRRQLMEWVARQKDSDKTIGFVPTMGALHAGHLSLIRKSNEQNDLTVCSIFVNPTQFDNPDDLKKYPRNSQADIQLLEATNCDAVFIPSVEDMYPDKATSEHFEFGGLENQMEGKFREGHFDGVATIVSRFFEIIQPDRAYFGEKDYQQLRIIQELVKQKNYSIEIVPMPIHREESGLAMSSRNARLPEHYTKEAIKIFEFLNFVKDKKEELSIPEMHNKAQSFFDATDLDLEYFMLCDEKTLEPVTAWDNSENIRAFIAAYAANIRLIDNLKIA